MPQEISGASRSSRSRSAARLRVPHFACRAVDVAFATVGRRDLTCARGCDESQISFLAFGRVVVRVQVRTTLLTLVGAVPVVLRLEVDDRHTDGLPVPLHTKASRNLEAGGLNYRHLSGI